MPTPPNFNLVARPYRWLEYLTLGPLLQRCRLAHLHHLAPCGQALVLGDGDGRLLAALLASNPHLHADAVDTSAAMLHLLHRRSATYAGRVTLHHADALGFIPTRTYDLVVTAFFLDCLPQPALDRLVGNLAPHLAPGALWFVADFRIPSGPLRPVARLLIRSLYLAFRILTGLRTTRLPDHGSALRRYGLEITHTRRGLGGILTSELWRLRSVASNTHSQEIPMTNPSPVPPIPPSPGTDLPSSPAPAHSPADPIPDPEPASPSLSEPDPGVFHHTVGH